MTTLIDAWLARATHGLSTDAITQVHAEIGEHYRSSYEAAIEAGSTANEAEFAAVAALGDARSANRQYRRVLLTAGEAKFLQRLTPDPSLFVHQPQRLTVGKWLAWILMAEAFIGMVLVAWKQHPWTLAIAPILAATLIRKNITIDTPRRRRVYRAAKWCAYIAGAALAAWYQVKPGWAPFTALLFPAYLEYKMTCIRRKLPAAQWPKQLL